ncbi:MULTISPECIES: hypothetical protein [Terrabacteria group]|uniref:hypothetical protein n=1 Tax=Bacillati TaxID=1783272 RepID=UPI001C6DE726|nr:MULTISPECIES: hypothetical protein [Terrabacteria group]MBW9211810.1 hypothetical protein [Trueperella sp. zg.1013]
MKRVFLYIISTFITVSFVISGFLKVNALEPKEQKAKNFDDNNDIIISISEPMTKEEAARKLSSEKRISYEKAFITLYPEAYKINQIVKSSTTSDTTRELTVGLTVKKGVYHPHMAFYCYTSEWGKYWGIKSMYYVTLVRSYKGTSKQFSGDIRAWLRSPYQIEYVINGDFYENATQTTSASASGEFGLHKLVKIRGGISKSVSSNHYSYFYEHRTVAFQS